MNFREQKNLRNKIWEIKWHLMTAGAKSGELRETYVPQKHNLVARGTLMGQKHSVELRKEVTGCEESLLSETFHVLLSQC